jgi:LacI family transcriptional regulator
VATVSRVLSGRGYASSRTRELVLQAAKEIEYVPNGMARGLKTQRSGLIALLVPEIVNSFYTTVSRGVEDVANANGLQVIVGNTDENVAKERAYIELMISSQVDGVIVAPAGNTAETLTPLITKSIPTVLVDRAVAGIATDIVRGDGVGDAATLTRHLLDLGHRRTALVNGHLDTSVARDREQGFRRAHSEAGLEVDERLISTGTWFIDDAHRRVGALLDEGERPDAIMATNNFMAIGAFRALRERGLRVPDDVAVACFDDIGDAAEIDPFLTAMAQPAYTMGTLAMQLLLERIAGTNLGEPREIVLESQLLARRSGGEHLAAQPGDVDRVSTPSNAAQHERGKRLSSPEDALNRSQTLRRDE